MSSSSPPPASARPSARLAFAAEESTKGGYLAVYAGLGAAAEAVEAPCDHLPAPGDDAEVVVARTPTAALILRVSLVKGPAPPPPAPPPPAAGRSPADTAHTQNDVNTRVDKSKRFRFK